MFTPHVKEAKKKMSHRENCGESLTHMNSGLHLRMLEDLIKHL